MNVLQVEDVVDFLVGLKIRVAEVAGFYPLHGGRRHHGALGVSQLSDDPSLSFDLVCRTSKGSFA